MEKEDLGNLIDSIANSFPDSVVGNEVNRHICQAIENIVNENRDKLVDLLRDWISIRIPQKSRKIGDGKKEAAMWLALEIAAFYKLKELKKDIQLLKTDIINGDTLIPPFSEVIDKYLTRIH